MRYCQKEESRASGRRPLVLGDVGGSQGRRSDLLAVADALKSGASLSDIAFNYTVPFIKFSKGIEKAAAYLVQAEGYSPKEVYIHWGETGTGKTRSVYDEHGYNNVFKWSAGMGKWFDGYDQQDVILCDDLRYTVDNGKCFLNGRTIAWWLNFLDGYPVQVEVKCGMRFIRASHVYITTNQDPKDWWAEMPLATARDPFMRRVTKVVHFNKYQTLNKN